MAEEPPTRLNTISREVHPVGVQVRKRELEPTQAESDW